MHFSCGCGVDSAAAAADVAWGGRESGTQSSLELATLNLLGLSLGLQGHFAALVEKAGAERRERENCIHAISDVKVHFPNDYLQ